VTFNGEMTFQGRKWGINSLNYFLNYLCSLDCLLAKHNRKTDPFRAASCHKGKIEKIENIARKNKSKISITNSPAKNSPYYAGLGQTNY
jgi:hypothetical protein